MSKKSKKSKKKPRHVWIVTYRKPLQRPTIQRYTFRGEAVGGLTVWSRGAIKHIRTVRDKVIARYTEQEARTELLKASIAYMGAVCELLDGVPNHDTEKIEIIPSG